MLVSDNLYYIKSATRPTEMDTLEICPLPDWSRFLINLGYGLSSDGGVSKTVVALVLPSISFSAAMVCLGNISEQIGKGIYRRRNDNHAHFEMLKALPNATPVTYIKESGASYTGILVERDDSEHLAVQIVRKGKAQKNSVQTDLITVDRCHLVNILPDFNSVQLPATINTAKVHEQINQNYHDNQLLEDLFGKDNIEEFGNSSYVDNVVFTNQKKFKEELDISNFTGGKGESTSGSLSSIVRLQETGTYSGSYNTVTESRTLNKNTRQHFDGLFDISEDPLIIFEGAKGFTNWGSEVENSNSNVVVLLSRDEAAFYSATEKVNQWGRKRKNGTETTFKDIETQVPDCIEGVIFTRA